MLSDLAKPWDAVGMQLAEFKEELGEIHAGKIYISIVNA